jgi:hypothetical protein
MINVKISGLSKDVCGGRSTKDDEKEEDLIVMAAL